MKYELILTTRELPSKKDMYIGEVEGDFDEISRLVKQEMKKYVEKYGYDAYLLKKVEKSC